MALNNGFQRWTETLREINILGGIHLELGNQERIDLGIQPSLCKLLSSHSFSEQIEHSQKAFGERHSVKLL